jgi:hypothetical protein
MERWLFLLLMLARLTSSSCPPGCECNDELLNVRCINASLEVSFSFFSFFRICPKVFLFSRISFFNPDLRK